MRRGDFGRGEAETSGEASAEASGNAQGRRGSRRESSALSGDSSTLGRWPARLSRTVKAGEVKAESMGVWADRTWGACGARACERAWEGSMGKSLAS